MENKNIILYAVQKGKKYYPEEYGWDYCIANKIPFILVDPKIKFAHVSYDLMSIDFGLSFPGKYLFYDRWIKYYDQYRSEKKLPDNQYSFVGGERNGGFRIWKDDYPEIVAELNIQIDDHVKKFESINIVSKEYHETLTRMNKMMNGLDPTTPYNKEEFEKLIEKLEVLDNKMNEKIGD